MRRAGWKRPLGVLLGLLVLVLGLPAAAQAQPGQSHPRPRPPVEDPAPTGPDCTTTPSSTQAGYSVADPRCVFNGAAYTGARFVPQTNAAGHPISRTFTGILAGAPYRIEVPKQHWNGQLVLFAHGFRGNGTTVWVDDSPLRTYLVAHGFAWAASSATARRSPRAFAGRTIPASGTAPKSCARPAPRWRTGSGAS